MNKITQSLGTIFFLLAMVVSLPSQAQAQETPTPKVNKELKSVLKEMPLEMQLEVLRYAERKRDAHLAIEAKKAEAMAAAAKVETKIAAAPEQQKAVAQPQPAQPAQPAQPNSIQLKPAQESQIAVQQPQVTQPQQPAYMQEAQELSQTSVQWYEEDVDLGNLKQGEVASHTYRFKNTGTVPLKLTRVKPSCGCTTPEYSKEEVAPGEEGFIKVNFNTAGKTGAQRKAITVTGNFEGYTKVLRFKGEILN